MIVHLPISPAERFAARKREYNQLLARLLGGDRAPNLAVEIEVARKDLAAAHDALKRAAEGRAA